MYLTIFRKSESPKHTKFTYDTITQISPTISEENCTCYKQTLDIKFPKHRKNLTEKQQNHIQNCELWIERIWENVLKPFEHNYEKQYTQFPIPKKSGGLRIINAPTENFKDALTLTKNIFENQIKILAHPAAYAYTKQRSILDAIKVHQNNHSKWFLKIDLKDFFPNCTPTQVFTSLMLLYPFYHIDAAHAELLRKITRVCSLNNGLPQGSPISPLFSNLVMVPFDYHIERYLIRGTGEHYAYTRYADDILISCKTTFDWKDIQTKIQTILGPCFEINQNKTRYGSITGSNWNLGLMLNKDNNITIGFKKKKLLNAMLNNFLTDYNKQQPWPIQDTQILQGQLSYLQQIEPEYYNYLIKKYNTKHQVTINEVFRTILK